MNTPSRSQMPGTHSRPGRKAAQTRGHLGWVLRKKISCVVLGHEIAGRRHGLCPRAHGLPAWAPLRTWLPCSGTGKPHLCLSINKSHYTREAAWLEEGTSSPHVPQGPAPSNTGQTESLRHGGLHVRPSGEGEVGTESNTGLPGEAGGCTRWLSGLRGVPCLLIRVIRFRRMG